MNNLDKKIYMIYYHMISRCYNINDQKYSSYGAIGIKVCDRWMNKNMFLEDIRLLYNYNKFIINPEKYELDKDYLQQNKPKNMRIYSPHTCLFLYYQDNLNLKHLEKMKENPSKSKYFGVEINSAGNYYARIKIKNNRINIGTFNNIIAAANAYNYYVLKYHNYELVPLLNDVPYMGPEEFIKYNVSPKLLYELIK